MDSNALLFFSYSLIFWLLSYLIIRKSKSPANLLFSSSTFLFGVGTLFSGLGWGPFATTHIAYTFFSYTIVIDQLTFFAVAASFIVLAPLGIYFSGRTILHGNPGYKDELALILYLLFLIIAIVNFFIYANLTLKQNFMLEDSLTTFILLLSIFVYVELYKQIPDYRLNFTIILIGFLVGVGSLLIGLTLFVLNYNSLAEVIRSMGPFLAVLIILISFTNLPHAVRSRSV